ncbi:MULTISPECIES: UDP-N-acetylmuramate:L-alanyl-gamma-D-glutamyl-meso-diaminopimelate ligase [Marinobacter]|jgi:UDP-N-acetylmuramate: L-alanyl-gamma-D-glutamyl-meso-diaminopimelate ligase|uniref:UDP-N-acetylmuramate--L-alanyl-gamma-D-glutamyl-meso-2,6-diaminoheptandioate ligase n=1 Tax=Marinobacter nauticus TaxID=2743 RepID=A0A833JSL9_MARNT|nr:MULTISPECIES: UDP-N-acetylmuramate:L-alanyl-gamma-D-glutamyl-meso-diaminopimelate ligase [Marinobacter]MCG8521267.1 UDP-N-acetylmuramate:L-alanyl-gamma-D-glutamyl-meso-diaminopimelate ligase [Pseudomonadales bacterium]MEC9084806.1 UDP-N-acetylmuramate:L-alanyl-gamma-D-glutamyl-meso-diaminopimelate ligase [Pseudomonadota bacterium]KAE8545310.1 UDP-N-acetylmuramate:L-alanyl-gamma-D-glutamyl- meso-diaminopimelate ligase [Marinobacter nauticus]MBY5963061.1 UDP-N-acetylmuramate:L-alanyl-gamma-D-g
MHIHILGICGTFMGSLAVIARELGHKVTGSDQGVYPPMSTQLEAQGIALTEGYRPENLEPKPDLVLIGNAMSRGNPEVEAVLNRRIDYMSGPEWLAREVLRHRWVMAVAGTHGKTTTTAMLLWILDQAGFDAGYLIGGVPQDFPVSARLGSSDFFVIEADEYDSAFFDKRSKFIHYRPNTLILNNLEFDHADIFENVEAIERQFHHLVRTVPSQGLIIRPALDSHLDNALEMGCWSPVQDTAIGSEISRTADWRAELLAEDGSRFMVIHHEQPVATLKWGLTGLHNVRNALSAIAAARHVGVTPDHAVAALCRFSGVKRRMELVGEIGGVRVYDDFAHHPTAIASTLEGLRNRVGDEPILAIIEPRSNTMKQGVHKQTLIPSAALADRVLWGNLSDMDWLPELVGSWQAEHGELDHHRVEASVEELIEKALEGLPETCHIVIMSNGGFGGIHRKLVAELEKRRG